MRRVLVALTLVALFLGGCTDKPSSTGSPGSSGTPRSSGVPGGGSGAPGTADPGTEAACDAAETALVSGLTTFLTELGNGLAAVSVGDRAKEEAAEKAMKAASDDLVTKLRAEAGKTSFTDLKAALEATAKTFQDVGSDVQKVDEAKLESVSDGLRKVCG